MEIEVGKTYITGYGKAVKIVDVLRDEETENYYYGDDGETYDCLGVALYIDQNDENYNLQEMEVNK